MKERLNPFINVGEVEVRQAYFKQALVAFSKAPGRLGSERLTPRTGSFVAEAFSKLNEQSGTVDKEARFEDPTAWAIKQAARCAVLAEGIRHDKASEAAKKGWETRRRNMVAKEAAIAQTSLTEQPSRVSSKMETNRPFVSKLRRGAAFALAAAGLLVSFLGNPVVVRADSSQQRAEDPIIQQRAAIVGSYLPLTAGISQQAAEGASLLLGRMIDPSAVEAGRLGIQQGLEALANSSRAEENLAGYKAQVENPEYRLGLEEEAVSNILRAQEINDQPRLPGLPDNSTYNDIQRYAHLLRRQENPGSRALLFVRLNEQGGGSEEERRLIERAAEMVGEFAVPTQEIVNVVAEANNNPWGANPAVMRAIAANHAKAAREQ